MKFFRKLRQTLISEGHLKKYLFYAIGEILLVMIGILLAFQVNNWNTNRIKRNTELTYYKNFKDQVLDDKRTIEDLMEMNNFNMAQYEYASQIIESNDRNKLDTLGYIALRLTKYSDFDQQGNIYESMINSGEIKQLNNFKIIEGLRKLGETYIYINRMENIHFDFIIQFIVPPLQKTIRLSTNQVEKPEQLYSYEFQNLIFLSIRIMREKDEIYHRAINEIDAITKLIEEEIKVDY